jgi:hypothetical protein
MTRMLVAVLIVPPVTAMYLILTAILVMARTARRSRGHSFTIGAVR